MPGNIRLWGTSGYVELAAPNTATNQVLTLPTDSVQPAMVLVASQSFSSVSTISINNCFSSVYENYRIIFTAESATASGIGVNFRYRSNGSDISTASYFYQYLQATGTSVSAARANSQTFYEMFAIGQRQISYADIHGPFTSVPSKTHVSHNPYNKTGGIDWLSYAGAAAISTQCDGFTLFHASATMTGNVRVYGYRNS